MTLSVAQRETLDSLLLALCDGQPAQERVVELERLVLSDPEAMAHYVRVTNLQVGLRWMTADGCENSETARGGLPLPPPRTDSNTYCPPVATPSLFSSPLHGTFGYFSSAGWPVAYLVATVILGIGLLIGAVTHVSQVQFAGLPSPPGRGAGGEGGRTAGIAHSSIVGRITGEVDCRFVVNSKTKDQRPKTAVSIGDKFALLSGLLEITYDTGAKVILQGPVTYQVESPAGGFLSLGKLTARVENIAIKDLRPKTQDANPKSPNLQISKFIVRTPTATVTDLGTEFGVEVNKHGDTTSHVFRGSVKVQATDAHQKPGGAAKVLRENESARVEWRDGRRAIVLVAPPRATEFVRAIPRHSVKTLDLLDIVAGGYGATGRRERGIDPTTGMEDPLFWPEARTGNGQYHAVTWHKLIDGVFTPGGQGGPVVVDSAGHTFDGFSHASGSTWGSIWPRAVDVKADGWRKGQDKSDKYWVYAMGRGRQFMPNDLGLLALGIRMGITFNLEAMRAAYPGVLAARFRATAGVADAHGLAPPGVVQVADIWVLVDGQLKFGRSKLRPQDGPVKVDVELRPNDRFLTLAATYGSKEPNFDWVVFGDPVLEMVPAEEREAAADRKEMP
jgi:hypothetical protein